MASKKFVTKNGVDVNAQGVDSTGGPLDFLVNGVRRMTIGNEGQVGIGVPLPTAPYKLEVQGDVKVGSLYSDGDISGVNAEFGNINASSLTLTSSTSADNLSLFTIANNQAAINFGVAQSRAKVSDTTTQNYLGLGSNNATLGTAGVDRLTIDMSGNVGIRTSAPQAVLDIHASSLQPLALRAGPSQDHVYVQFFPRSSNLTARGGFMGYPSAGSNRLSIVNEIGSVWLGATGPGTAVSFSLDNIEYARVSTAGLGIGTTTPSRKIHVVENTPGTTRIAVSNTNTAGYPGFEVIGSPGSSVFEIDNASQTSILKTVYSGNLSFGTGDIVQATIDVRGNFGIGVVPSTDWNTQYKALQLKGGTLSSTGFNDLNFAQNLFYGTSNQWRHVRAGGATLYRQAGSTHSWSVAPSSSTSWAANLTQAMVLNANGNLGVGVENPTTRLQISAGANSNAALSLIASANTIGNFASQQFSTASGAWNIGTEAGNARFFIYNNTAQADQLGFSGGINSGVSISSVGTGAVTINTALTERLRVDYTGNIGIGTTNPGAFVHVQKTSGNATLRVQTLTNDQAAVDLVQPARHYRIINSGGALSVFDQTEVANRIQISASGKVAIGSTSPQVSLHIDGQDAIRIPAGPTSQRPLIGANGDIRFNTTNNAYEGYTNGVWGGFGGASGGNGNAVFYENDATVTSSYTITSGKNAMSAGPISINAGVEITIPNNSNWAIV
jgi:hypothetical protein